MLTSGLLFKRQVPSSLHHTLMATMNKNNYNSLGYPSKLIEQKKSPQNGGGARLSYEVVEGPEVLFFLDDDIFKHTAGRCVTAFKCFGDDLAVKLNGLAL